MLSVQQLVCSRQTRVLHTNCSWVSPGGGDVDAFCYRSRLQFCQPPNSSLAAAMGCSCCKPSRGKEQLSPPPQAQLGPRKLMLPWVAFAPGCLSFPLHCHASAPLEDAACLSSTAHWCCSLCNIIMVISISIQRSCPVPGPRYFPGPQHPISCKTFFQALNTPSLARLSWSVATQRASPPTATLVCRTSTLWRSLPCKP